MTTELVVSDTHFFCKLRKASNKNQKSEIKEAFLETHNGKSLKKNIKVRTFLFVIRKASNKNQKSKNKEAFLELLHKRLAGNQRFLQLA